MQDKREGHERVSCVAPSNHVVVIANISDSKVRQMQRISQAVLRNYTCSRG